MKKVVGSAMAVIFCLTAVQSKAQKGFSISVKGTPQLSWMSNSDDNDESSFENNSKFGANFGIGAQYNFTDNMGVGVDVLYSLQGRKYDLGGKTYNQKNQYIKLPVYFSCNTLPSKKVAFSGQAGPQLSFLANSKLDGGNFINAGNKDRYKDVTFGIMANAGVQFAVAKNIYLNTALRFDHDLTNAEEDNYFTGFPAERANTYNSTLGLEIKMKYQLQ